ncbi:hypothetical protein BX659_13920 [Orenia metallireducens]|uniref:Uncharacterized protein n=1 Tax=Orenia metallireducens TaxID=1413210 RepID=A0A285IE16_9FIRM|nr:hypothetical protein [Orenia metallireducens]PRX19239.1 hypothetical protein BX659_13920 [Orenia metallireducens]SNY46192.1 hypothetical protein SAMN06265827_14110 [Orenia metallireducens]
MEILAGLILVGVIVGVFYLIGKKVGAFEQKDSNDDDFSCH